MHHDEAAQALLAHFSDPARATRKGHRASFPALRTFTA